MYRLLYEDLLVLLLVLASLLLYDTDPRGGELLPYFKSLTESSGVTPKAAANTAKVGLMH